jgi:hypothetical protein
VVLRTEVGQALTVPRRALLERARRAIDFDGASRAAEHLLDLAAVRAGV